MNYIFSDLDNTLLFQGKISDKNLEAIKKWKEAGNKFVIATGRGLMMMDIIFNNYPGLADYYILNNGALITDKDRNILNINTMSNGIAKSIIRELDKNSFIMAVETTDKLYSIGEFHDDICPEVGELTTSIDEDTLLSMDLNAIFLNCAPRDTSLDKAIQNYDFLNEKYGKEVSIFRNQHWVDIIPKNLSKGLSIKKLLEMENINADNIYVIGDSLNDLSMFESYEESYTFDSSEESVKNKSKYVISNFHEMVDRIMI